MPDTQTPFGVLRALDACELLIPPTDRLDSRVLAHSRRWQVVGTFMRCVSCGHSQKASDGARPFPHHPDCRALIEAQDFPWRELADVLKALPT
ncbi:hypothetical protein [Pseudomonas caspiana]|uniref:hypothetical protein n=1 Tax=Pseudomonas caspiana TaxID=1451454 RepID=UPI0011982635|nr:hypothetical protein [Pseudomonas caspiana]